MSQGYIDSATLFEVVAHARRSEFRHDWAARGAHAATVALLYTEHLHVPKSPIRSGDSEGPYRLLMEGVQTFGTSLTGTGGEASVLATSRTKEWAISNVTAIKGALQGLAGDKNFQAWLESEITWVWSEYARRMNGLFTLDFAKQLAPSLELTELDLVRLHERTIDPKYVYDLSRRREGMDFSLLSHAYVGATLIRGRYYAELARLAKQQVLQHPIRTSKQTSSLTEDLKKPTIYRFSCSLTETIFGAILVNSMFVETKVEERLALWLANVGEVRNALRDSNSDARRRLRSYESRLPVARDIALSVAKNLNIRTHSKSFEAAIDLTLTGGVLAATSFYLQPWLGVAAGLTAHLASRRDAAQSLANRIANRRSRLLRLASCPGGSIDAPGGDGA